MPDPEFPDPHASDREYYRRLHTCTCTGRIQIRAYYLGVPQCNICRKLREHKPIQPDGGKS